MENDDPNVGKVFGRLTYKKMSMVKDGRRAVCICDCSCGKTDIRVRYSSLVDGSTRSCGCLRTEYKNNRFLEGFKLKSMVTLEKKCPCGKEFKMVFDENNHLVARSARRRIYCDTCIISKSIGKVTPKNNW